MMKRAPILLALALCACGQKPENRFPDPVGIAPLPPPVVPGPQLNDTDRAEYDLIERHCLEATDARRQLPGWDCGFGGLEDARLWAEAYNTVHPASP